MKKYSGEYFEKKFHILFQKLRLKDGFIDEIKRVRKKLGIPIGTGFADSLHLAEYLVNKLNKDEKEYLSFFVFIAQYEIENKIEVNEANKDDVMTLFEKSPKKIGPLEVLIFLQMRINDHNSFFTQTPIVGDSKALSDLFSKEFAIFQKFFGVDLLDEHIIMQFIEKYLYLDEKGVNTYIREKIACPACRHIGISHFSPDGHNMDGRDEGPFSGKYLFNASAVKLLSSHFNSCFLIIKPYATKEQTIQYIKENWDHMKEHLITKNTFYKQAGVHPSKIKVSNFERNRLVYELYKLPKKELLDLYRGKKDFSLIGIYKETVIAAILKEQYEIEMSTDAIKKAATRFAKNARINNEPKDIRDI